MNIGIGVNFVFNLPIRERDINILMELSKHHYDGKCKSASGENGFLSKWKAILRSWDGIPKDRGFKAIGATSNELDTCLKIMEIDTALYGRFAQERPAAILRTRKMRKAFIGALTMANSKYYEWKIEYRS